MLLKPTEPSRNCPMSQCQHPALSGSGPVPGCHLQLRDCDVSPAGPWQDTTSYSSCVAPPCSPTAPLVLVACE